MTESKKRDFVSQLIVIMEQNAQLLTDKGFDPAEKIAARFSPHKPVPQASTQVPGLFPEE